MSLAQGIKLFTTRPPLLQAGLLCWCRKGID